MNPLRYDLDTLEFAVVREILEERLTTPLGRTVVEHLLPMSAQTANRALDEARELAVRFAAGDVVPMSGVVEVRSWLESFFHGERLPDTRDLADLKRLLRAACRCRGWLTAEGPAQQTPSAASVRDTAAATSTSRICQALEQMADTIPDVTDLAGELEMVVDDRGEVLSTASMKLAEIRREIDAADLGVRSAVQRFLADEQVRRCLQSAEPGWRHGRPVFQVRQEWRHRVPGVLHDRSQSGATLFVEPSAIVEAANRLSDAKAAEHREVLVILAHVCRGLRHCQKDVEGTVSAMAELDVATARARLLQEGWFAAPVVEGGVLRLRGAKHPILLRRAHSQPVPLDVTLGDPYRLLVVTGPNTGGKTVVVKTIGLLSLMALSGVPIPAAEGSQVPWLDGVFADIGDEQAITQNLSTFSAHVKRIARCLAQATDHSLVLLDELGAGTDPEEGGALGYAVLEDLERRRIHAAVTTHLGRLKDFAYQHAGAENGAMAFDHQTLQPLYRLETGIPGVSHALDIAGGVGMPQALVSRARELLGRRDKSLEHVVQQVQIVRQHAEADRKQTQQHYQQAAQVENRLRDKLQEVEVRQAWFEEEATALVEEELRAARLALESPLRELQNAPRPFGEKAKALLDNLRELLQGGSVHRRRMKFIGRLRKDAVVYLPRFDRRATVKKVDRVREVLVLEMGKMRMEVPFEDVSWLQPLEQARGDARASELS